MPKGNELFGARLDFFVKAAVRLQVIAIGYHMGARGKHAAAARKLLELGIQAYLEGLTQRELEEYELIMSRIRLIEDPKALEEI